MLDSKPKIVDPDVTQPVFCKACRKEAVDVVIFCLHCRTRFPRPFSFQALDQDFISAKGVKRFVIVATDDACEECRKADGKEVARSELGSATPIKTCTRAVCWCTIIAEF